MKWITRERARVDRIACPWLISRFIDPSPHFLFVPAAEVLASAEREAAVPYDVPNVELGHRGALCSFDAFIGRYELSEPGLEGLARIVRGADTDDRGLTPESAGLYAAATGFQATSRDDFDNMARQFPMYDALYAYARGQAKTAPARRVLFVCLHGAAKSVVAAAHFRRLAATRGLPIEAVAAGTEPGAGLAPAAVRGLASEGLAAAPARPRPVTLYDLASAARVVSFGCEVTPAQGQPVEQWDVPAISDGYAARARPHRGARRAARGRAGRRALSMALRRLGFVDLPSHVKGGGFDHAAVHRAERLGLRRAHRQRRRRRHRHRAQGVRAVDPGADRSGGRAGRQRTRSGLHLEPRGEHRRNLRSGGDAARRQGRRRRRTERARLRRPAPAAARRPRGRRRRPGSRTVSVVDVDARKVVADVPVAGRTRWAVYDPAGDVFHVNIADPPQIAVVEAADPVAIRRVIPVPHAGPHGLDIDVERRRLFCACDSAMLLSIDADRGDVITSASIAGVPDVVFFNARLQHLYVAIGEPGVIEVFDTARWRRVETVVTEAGAHTLSFDAARNLVCAFLPGSHRAAVYEDVGD